MHRSAPVLDRPGSLFGRLLHLRRGRPPGEPDEWHAPGRPASRQFRAADAITCGEFQFPSLANHPIGMMERDRGERREEETFV
jgi:hypothetical protein